MVDVNNYKTAKSQMMKIQSLLVQNTPRCRHRTNWTDFFCWWWWWWWPWKVQVHISYLNTRLNTNKTNDTDCTKITTLSDFNLPAWCKWGICSSEKTVDW